eukprot:gene38533-47581_t
MACPKSFTSDGLETQFGVNIGHFPLTTELVITLSSNAHFGYAVPQVGIRLNDLQGEQHYDAVERYGASKLANVLFAQELQERSTADGGHVISVSVHPGVIFDTNLSRHVDQSMVEAWKKMMPDRLKTIPQGVATTLFTALSPDIVPGAYYADSNVETVEKNALCGDVSLQRNLWSVSEEI